jgi:ABC-type antimicrobial peptide transport system permease subunit
MALGAGERRVLGGILRESFALVAIGVVLGLGGALAATRFIESLLFGLAPDDPATIAVTVAVMLGATAVSAYVPARRESRVNPIVALRHE